VTHFETHFEVHAISCWRAHAYQLLSGRALDNVTACLYPLSGVLQAIHAAHQTLGTPPVPVMLQVDDQLWSSALPVVLCTLPTAERRPPPAMEFTMLMETSVTGGRRRMPYLTLDVPLRLQIAVSESIAWRVLKLVQGLPLDVLADPSTPGPSPTSMPQLTPAVDAMLLVGLLAISDVDGTLFFRASPVARPRDVHRYISAAALNMLPDSLDSVRLKLEGREVTQVSMRSSQLQAIMQEQLRAEVYNIAFSLLYSYLGYFGTSAVSQGLSAASHGLKKVAGVSRSQGAQSAPVSGITDGVRQGAGSAVEGLFKGIRGVYQRPLAGARAGGGASGFMKGLGQGIAGVVTMPLAGAMDLGASTMQGVNASLTSAIHGRNACVLDRTRMQRAVEPSGALAPFDMKRALGHALLQLTMSSANLRRKPQLLASLSQRKPRPRMNAAAVGGGHQLDQFFMVPDGKVVLLTNQCILVLSATEFAKVFQILHDTGMLYADGLAAGVLSAVFCGSLASKMRAWLVRTPRLPPTGHDATITRGTDVFCRCAHSSSVWPLGAHKELLILSSQFVNQLHTAPFASAGELLWLVPWSNVLAPELRGKPGQDATHVHLHLRQPTPPHDMACESSSQAHLLQHAIQRHLGLLLRIRLLDSQLSGGAIEDAGMPNESVCTIP
jgi:hypothetical protein